MKVGSGSKVTLPSEFTVYVPWFVIVKVVLLHEAARVPVTQIRTEDEVSVVPDAGVSLALGSYL